MNRWTIKSVTRAAGGYSVALKLRLLSALLTLLLGPCQRLALILVRSTLGTTEVPMPPAYLRSIRRRVSKGQRSTATITHCLRHSHRSLAGRMPGVELPNPPF
jgi:hypothetical protein